MFDVPDISGIMIENWAFLHMSCMVIGRPLIDKVRFDAALRLAAEDVLHVGDDPELDVIGATRAGLRSAWLHRGSLSWHDASAQSEIYPDLIVRDLAELADVLDETAAGQRGTSRAAAN